MKIFHCGHCGHLLFFENTECVSCGHRVAYLPDLQMVASLDADGDDKWHAALPQAAASGYRLCQNDKIEGTCNWAVPADDDSPLCVSCRTTRVIPNLADPDNRARWYRLEVAKRRLLFTLIELGLPLQDGVDHVGTPDVRGPRTRGRSAGAVRLTLSTAHTNLPAQSLYEATGWLRDEIFRSYHLALY